MPRHIRLEPHLTVDELERRYQGAQEPHERSWFQILWLLAKGQTATAVERQLELPVTMITSSATVACSAS